ncbi:hypothetical protein ACHAWF_005497 [Thalassiosira exigua]
MVRGNWQRRVERTEARRTAAKLQKEHRRNKRHSSSGGADGGDHKASYRRLEEWLDDKGDGIGVSFDDGGGGAFAAEDTWDRGADSRAKSRITVDVWTDARPANRPEYLPALGDGDDFDDDDDAGRGSKSRSKGKQKERFKGSSKKSKGKAHPHPNAKNKSGQENHDEVGRERSGSMSRHNPNDDRLCAQEFFFGKETCGGMQHFKQLQRQKGGRRGRSDSFGAADENQCSLQHYHQVPKIKGNRKAAGQSPPMTLGQVLNEKSPPHHLLHCRDDGIKPAVSLPNRLRESILKSAFNSATNGSNGTTCIDMIFHSRFFVDNFFEDGNIINSDNDEDGSVGSNSDHSSGRIKRSKIHDSLLAVLHKELLSTSSLVYLTIQGVLIYDRNRGGIVCSGNEEGFLLFAGPIDDIVAVNDDADNDHSEPLHIHEELTHHLLDEILSYCGDETAATLPQVCTSWRAEVGTRSPQLWKMLLGRHDWPLISTENLEDASCSGSPDEIQQCRDAFVLHYTAVRDVQAMANACVHMAGGANRDKHGVEYASQVFKSTKASPTLAGDEKNQCIVKVWSASSDGASTRALAAYYDECALRLFDVVRGSSSSSAQGGRAQIKCRQIVCVRAAPPSISRKKDSCEMMSMDLDDDLVACLIEESNEQSEDADMTDSNARTPWIWCARKEDIVCAGNEGMLEDECVQSFDLRSAILDFMLSASTEELRVAFHSYLALTDGFESDVQISVTPKIIACGKGHLLFHAFIQVPIPVDSEETHEHVRDHVGSFGHRLFLLSTQSGLIVKCLQLGMHREATRLFASRPFRCHESSSAANTLVTNLMVAGPTMAFLFITVKIRRDGSTDILKNSIIENEALQPWSQVDAAMTASCAIFSTDPVQGPALYFQRLLSSHDEFKGNTGATFHVVDLGGPENGVLNMFDIRKHYIAVIVGERTNNDDEEDEIGGHWFGHDEAELILFHLPTRQEIHRCSIPSKNLAVDCVGDTLAVNVSNLGFVITGENARDKARLTFDKGIAEVGTPSGKNPKAKKKRLASLASGRKKDGFARGMSLRG